MEANLRSCTFFGSNIAASAPTLPFPVRDAGVSSRHVKRCLRVSTSRAKRLELCNFRANLCEQGDDGEEVTPVKREIDALKKGITLEKVVVGNGSGRFRSSSGIVELNFGSSSSIGAPGDGFRGSPLPDFGDEFFARMIALEASPLSSLRARSTSMAAFFEGSPLCAGCEPPRPSPGQGVESSPGDSIPGVAPLSKGDSQQALGVLGMGGVQLPRSIKKLRRRKNEVSGESRLVLSGCAIKRAFSSMVYMIKAVQSHALQIRQALFCDKWDMQQVLHLVDQEMHSSFIWLFQRVFACTPTLMVSVMILLANFTVFSMGENVAIATVTETPPAIVHILATYPNKPQPPSLPVTKPFYPNISSFTIFSPPGSGYGAGGKNYFPSAPTKKGFDGSDSWENGFTANGRYGFSEKEFTTTLNFDTAKQSHREMMKTWVESTMKNHVTQLEQETTQRLVAPVVSQLEYDKYACFDRTDLEYQLALVKDPGSAVLLSNYAQFTFVVRRDNDRAEQYFHRAMEADPHDSTILGRFASFLWLGRGNRSAVERAYKAAVAAEPESSYPAGSYAHFLWHAGDDDSHGSVG